MYAGTLRVSLQMATHYVQQTCESKLAPAGFARHTVETRDRQQHGIIIRFQDNSDENINNVRSENIADGNARETDNESQKQKRERFTETHISPDRQTNKHPVMFHYSYNIHVLLRQTIILV